MCAGRSLSSDHGSSSPSTPSTNGPAGTSTDVGGHRPAGRQRRARPEQRVAVAQLVRGQHRLDVLLLVLLDHRVGEQVGSASPAALEAVEDPAADVGDERARLARASAAAARTRLARGCSKAS